MEYALTQRRKSGKIYDVDKTDKEYKKAKEEYEKAKADYEKNPNDQSKKTIFETKKTIFESKQTYRDDLGNIKKFGHAEKQFWRGVGQTLLEGAEGVARGAATGAVVGSIVPGIGTAIGAGVGGLAGAIRNLALHSGTTNRQAGNKDFHKEEFRDTYQPGSGAPAHHEPAHDDHGGGGHH